MLLVFLVNSVLFLLMLFLFIIGNHLDGGHLIPVLLLLSQLILHFLLLLFLGLGAVTFLDILIGIFIGNDYFALAHQQYNQTINTQQIYYSYKAYYKSIGKTDSGGFQFDNKIYYYKMQGQPQPAKQSYTDSDEKSKKAFKYLRIFNIVTALIVIGLSIFSLVVVIINALTSLKFFLIFSPVFMVAFGLCLLGAEFKIRYILKKFPALKTPLGRGLFYLYLSSVIYYYFEVIQNQFMAWAGAITLFVSGVIYMGIHLGFSKTIKKEDIQQEYEESYKERLI